MTENPLRLLLAILVAFLLAASQIPTAVSIGSNSVIVQHVYDVPSPHSANYSANFNDTLPLPVQQKDLLIVAAAFSSGAPVYVSDSLGSTWTRSQACYYNGACFSDLGLGVFYSALNRSGVDIVMLNTTKLIAFEAFEISNANLSVQGSGGGWANIVSPVKPYQAIMASSFAHGSPGGEFGFAFGAITGVNSSGVCFAGPNQSPGNWTIESYCGKTLSGGRQVFGEFGTTPAVSTVSISLTANETSESPGHFLDYEFTVDPTQGSIASLPTSTSQSSSVAGRQGISEFPPQIAAIIGLAVLLVSSYLVARSKIPELNRHRVVK